MKFSMKFEVVEYKGVRVCEAVFKQTVHEPCTIHVREIERIFAKEAHLLDVIYFLRFL